MNTERAPRTPDPENCEGMERIAHRRERMTPSRGSGEIHYHQWLGRRRERMERMERIFVTRRARVFFCGVWGPLMSSHV